MSQSELTKTIEATKVNPRTGIALSGPPTTIPYGAILDDVRRDGDLARFSYLREPYQCKYAVLQEASRQIDGPEPSTATLEAPESAAPRPKPKLDWEEVESGQVPVLRAKAPGGWLVANPSSGALTYIPDPNHKW